jgi:hypothetical protein
MASTIRLQRAYKNDASSNGSSNGGLKIYGGNTKRSGRF